MENSEAKFSNKLSGEQPASGENSHAIDMALNIARKNEALKAISNRIDKLRADPRFKGCYKELYDLQMMIKQTLQMDRERETFHLLIREKNEHFYRQLNEKFPNLTPSEQRLCTLIRLGLSSKETAEVLNISVKSVEMNRYRLRKKLKIAKSVSLSNFIRGL